jgi:hypothetical protein
VTVERAADWARAEVEATQEGFVLSVPVDGDLDPDWDDSFRRAVERRRHEVWGGQWGHVRSRPNQICVEQVAEGSEAPLRGFLDACVREADAVTRQEEADRREDEEALERKRTEASYGHAPSQGRNLATAGRMTERFRAP